MASVPLVDPVETSHASLLDQLSQSEQSIGGARYDFLLLWGVPLIIFALVQFYLSSALLVRPTTGEAMIAMLMMTSAVVTYAHLVAAAPRAYLNREVFAAHRTRLTVTPVLLVAALMISPALLALAGVVAVFWDVHHSAMQNFGLARIYDMKAGNDARVLRRADLRLSWMLYVGPIMAGASLAAHFQSFDRLATTSLSSLADLPGVFETQLPLLRAAGVIAYLFVLGWAVLDYRAAARRGYRLPAHKAALIGTTGLVSLLAWGFASPLIAFTTINLYHAIQYFALVWVKEGARIQAWLNMPRGPVLLLFLGGCGAAGIAYQLATSAYSGWILAPFIACSLLHFWYDGFIWSVGKKLV